jgi:polyphosphate kinase
MGNVIMHQEITSSGAEPERTRRRRHPQINRSNTDLFFNRELSWMQFNFRVLEEAARKDNPLLERLKFIAIYESNMHEFFMVRVAGLKQIIASSYDDLQLDGRTAEATLKEIHRIAHQGTHQKYRILDEILTSLSHHGIVIIREPRILEAHERKFLKEYFDRELFRILTPLAIDPSHPFPRILNGRLNLAFTLKRKTALSPKGESYAIVEVPSVLPRFVELPHRSRSSRNIRRFITLEDIIKIHAADLFSGTTIKTMHGFVINRNSDLSVEDVSSENLLSTIEEELKNRKWGEAVRLNYRQGMPAPLLEYLREKLDLEPEELYERPFFLNLDTLMEIYQATSDRVDLRDRPFFPRNAVPLEKPEKIFSRIRKSDILLHHPYDSFQTVVDLLQVAAHDPKVLGIKQTLYRTSGDSPIVRSLIAAAEAGKQVTALVELKARFDEERNIVWAREMERHGIHVVYGLVGLKIHAKMLQIIRREPDGVRSYCHLATGNYNPTTARVYTDLALITADPVINDDVTNLFHTLTGYSTVPRLSKISVAPINMRETISKLINREIHNAESGKPAFIRMKLNSLVDPDMILLLYRASTAGVKIELSVRGICCLKPGLPGISDNIRVESIVGRFLEHSRIYYFENAGDAKIFLSSADLMPRNLNRRVEVFFPVESSELKQKLIAILDAVFRDNHNARRLQSDGTYTRLQPEKSEMRFSSQRHFREEVIKEFDQKEKERAAKRKSIFQPLTNPGQDEQPQNQEG